MIYLLNMQLMLCYKHLICNDMIDKFILTHMI